MHDFDQIRPGRTLHKLYLDPILKLVEQNNGSVYGNGEGIILLVDIKDDALRTYKLLCKILEKYKFMLTVTENEKHKLGAVSVVVSGNRPIEFMETQTKRMTGYDGRLADLYKNIAPGIMPMVSDNRTKHFKWDGNGTIPENEKQKLNELVDIATTKGDILRFWGTLNKSSEQRHSVWRGLKAAGIGLIGADNQKELQDFFENEKLY